MATTLIFSKKGIFRIHLSLICTIIYNNFKALSLWMINTLFISSCVRHLGLQKDKHVYAEIYKRVCFGMLVTNNK